MTLFWREKHDDIILLNHFNVILLFECMCLTLVHIKTHKFSLLIVTFICWYWINCCPYNGKNSLTNWQQLQHAHHNHDIHFHFDLIVMLMTMIIITNIKFKIVYVQGLLVQSNYVVIWKTYYDFWALQLKWLDAHNQTNAWLLFRYFVW